MEEEGSPILKTEDVAAWLHVSKRTVQNLARAGLIPHFRIFKEYRFHRRVIAAWIANGQNWKALINGKA